MTLYLKHDTRDVKKMYKYYGQSHDHNCIAKEPLQHQGTSNVCNYWFFHLCTKSLFITWHANFQLFCFKNLRIV